MSTTTLEATWTVIAHMDDLEINNGFCYKHGNEQIGIFNLEFTEWYAVQNMCPHRQQMVMSRGLVGDCKGVAKISCPLHKQCFDLHSGEHLGDHPEWKLKTYPVKVEGKLVLLQLPPKT